MSLPLRRRPETHNNMIIFNDHQKNIIKSLNPLTDSKFLYNKSKWKGLSNNYQNLIEDFENKEIARQNIVDAYTEYFEDNSKCHMKAFLLTMIWGFADTGYGTFRTNNYISNNQNISSIKKALDYINQDSSDSLKKAFESLVEIKGLGISYLTKILYFATKAKKSTNYALIFDIRVARALIKLTTPKEIYDIISIGPSSKFKDYEKYNKLIREIAQDNQVDPDQVEMYLFNQDFE